MQSYSFINYFVHLIADTIVGMIDSFTQALSLCRGGRKQIHIQQSGKFREGIEYKILSSFVRAGNWL